MLPVFSMAQSIFSITWDTSLGTGETGDYISKFSARGVTFFEFRSFVSDNISVGGSIGWHVLFEKESGTFTDNNQTATGTQLRYLNSFPIMASSHYYFGDDGSIAPYIGLGLGAYSVEQRTDMGLFSSIKDNWHFGLAPEVGTIFPISLYSNIILKVKYNYIFESSAGPHQYMNFSLGFAWY